MTIRKKTQLITYPDGLGGNLDTLNQLLLGHFADLFQGGIHILPPFPSSADRGFAPTTYREIDPAFGTWDDIGDIGKNFDITMDLMVNHISRQSVYVQDFMAKGRRSEYADLFITLDKVWPDGNPLPEDISRIFLRKPEHPFLDIEIAQTRTVERVWASFGPRADWSEQIDLDVHSVATRRFFERTFEHFAEQSVRMVRLDAVGYVIKKPGTSCFMVEPDVYEFIDWLTDVAHRVGIELLPEVHAHYTTQLQLAGHGYWVYDFVLPALILHTLFSRSSRKLKNYLKICPRNQFTMLDCHDGIPVQPDLDDILTVDESRRVVDMCLSRGANLNRMLSPNGVVDGFDVHQINCTYYSALGGSDDAYLAARAIQLFAPGIPQIYYVGLLAGENDLEGVEQTGEGRAINRHNFSVQEVEQALQKNVVQKLFNLIRLRDRHLAFEGTFEIAECSDTELILSWRHQDHSCQLHVDLLTSQALIEHTDPA